jgi:SAM-dependent methyltransferase
MIEGNSLNEFEDPAGYETLELFADTNRFNRWMFDTLKPFCTDHILEIGSGIGNISAFLIRNFKEVSLSDMRQEYCSVLEKKFRQSENLKGIYLIDLADRFVDQNHPELMCKFNTILASNVVEHIEDDGQAVSNCYKLLAPGGHLVILVPAYRGLYNSFDRSLGHYRRYTRKSLTKLMEREGFEILETKYFNAMGMLGWWFSGTVLKKEILPKNQLNLYNKLIPLMRLADIATLHRTGLSVIAVGKKIK